MMNNEILKSVLRSLSIVFTFTLIGATHCELAWAQRFVAQPGTDLAGKPIVVNNWFIAQDEQVIAAGCNQCVANSPNQNSYQNFGSSSCAECSSDGCGSQSCNAQGCPNPFHPAAYVPPSEQPIGLRGCACENCIRGIDCANSGGKEQRWSQAIPIDFQPLRHGEWIGPVRLPSMLYYRVRVGDQLQFVFINTHEERNEPYRLMVGDELLIRSVTDEKVNAGDQTRGPSIQPDGLLHLPYIEPVHAGGMTIDELRKELEKRYKSFLKNPAIDVLPVRTNTKLQDLAIAVSNFRSSGGQNINATVNPDGRIQLPVIGNVRVIGMTLEEIKREVNLQYKNRDYYGIDVEPRLDQQAQHFVYVSGEVVRPGRVELLGPTTVSQALSMAEGIRVGGNMRQVVIFRRGEDWRLLATMLDLRAEMLGKRPNPADEIWLRDGDLIIVPPQPIRVFDNFVRLVFTEGVYGVAPASLFNNNN